MAQNPNSFRAAIAPLIKRTGQLIWYVDHWGDVEADMHVFFQIEDPENYPDAAKFFRLMYRLPAYRGAMRERAMKESYEAEHGKAPPTNSKIKSKGAKEGFRRVKNDGEQEAFLRNQDAERAKVKPTGPSYLKQKLKNAP